MKASRFLIVVVISILPLLCGCPDTKKVTTTIHKDGRTVRSVGDFDPRSFKGVDSVKHELPVPVDQSWELYSINDSSAVLRKEFNSVDELNELYSFDESELGEYQRNVVLEKKFRWFHTSMIYKETYNGLLEEIPLTDYLSEQEIECFKMEHPEDHPLLADMESKAMESLMDNIDERLGLWLNDNIFSMAFDDIVDIGDSLNILNKESLEGANLKDTIEVQWQISDRDFILFSEDEMEMIELVEMIGNRLELDTMQLLEFKAAVKSAYLDDKYENQLFADLGHEHYNQVIMPGQLIDTNAEKIQGDTLVWQMNSMKFIDSDYIMYAESRLTNLWAYIVSGIILVIAIIIPFLKKKKA
jgi:hypothetical protein